MFCQKLVSVSKHPGYGRADHILSWKRLCWKLFKLWSWLIGKPLVLLKASIKMKSWRGKK